MSAFEEKYRKKTPGAEPAPAAATPATEVPQGSRERGIQSVRGGHASEVRLVDSHERCDKHANTSIPYSRRNHMITDGNGFVISMHFDTPVISVTLQGRNLSELHARLLEHEVHWVMEFDPRKWATPRRMRPASPALRLRASRCPSKRRRRAAGQREDPGKPVRRIEKEAPLGCGSRCRGHRGTRFISGRKGRRRL
jgi:hypothetical protein